MTYEKLKAFLSAPFSKATTQTFVSDILIPAFGIENFTDGFMADALSGQPDLKQSAGKWGISSIRTVGIIQVDMQPLYVFDVTVSDRVQLERNRVSLQRIIRQIMDVYSSAFMLFHYEGESQWDWRFSFCDKGGSNKETTQARRYTFILGPGQSCRTAAENFAKLINHEKPIVVKDIIDAFDVEALSNEFFEGYKRRYENFVEYITGKRFVKRGQKWVEEKRHEPHPQMYSAFGCDDKRVRDYVKKLLGRIVFLHFLQKKGWMGLQPGADWGTGDLHFMRHLYEQASEEQKGDFLDQVLEPLFSDALDKERPNSLFDTHVDLDGGSVVRIPYLNGGLFERDDNDRITTRFPREYFCDLLEFFAEYNFTIDENDPDDAQVGIDPEMLGRIFENLLEDNKDKGAYYTPKEIVQYMCRQSLTAYLQTGVESESDRELIAGFVESKDSVPLIHLEDPQLGVRLEDRLRDVKVCDPAIGSGAFPMGMLREIYLCRLALEGSLADPAELKRHIIQHNIYGVDIERGAVDIARLRFWLSLIVDEKSPETLPNLDFKIMQGNSLLEQYQGVDLSTLTKTKEERNDDLQATWFDDLVDIYRKELRELLVVYYNCADHDRKDKLRKEIASVVRKQLAEQGIDLDFGDLDLSANSEFFLWHTWFNDVFQQGGFDILLGNPPYGAKLSDSEKRIYKQNYITAKTIRGIQKGSLDSYTLFIELVYSLLSMGGCMAMIVPISITSSDALSGVHRLLFSNCDNIHISSYAVRPEPVFKNAVVNTSILTLSKTGKPCEHVYATKMYRKGHNFNLQYLVDHLKFVDVKRLLLFGRIPKISEPTELRILYKLSSCHRLGEYLQSSGSPIVYRFAGGRYFKVVTNYSNGSSAERTIYFDPRIANSIGCILSSNLSFWFYQIYSDNLNWKNYEISQVPIPELTSETISKLEKLYKDYLIDIEKKANIRQSSGNSSYKVNSFKEYKIGRSKAIVDKIDDLICPLYGLTKEETEFIKNYEIEFRLTDDE